MSEILARQLAAQGIRDERVLDAIARLDRRLFVPAWLRLEADGDWPLPIGSGQTISQPWVVAYMTEELALTGTERVLEVGTGSGYQAAVLSLLAREVYSVEVIPELAEAARKVLLEELRLGNVHLRAGDGAAGWPEAAPFDRIVVTAAAPEIAPAWSSQLASGGRLILPLGMEGGEQVLRLVTAEPGGALRGEDLVPVRFVPLTHPGAPRDGIQP